MNTDDTMTIHGLSAWFQAEPRPHHLDLRLQVGGQELRACLLTPDTDSYTVHLYRSDGVAVRDNGGGLVRRHGRRDHPGHGGSA